MRALTEAGSGRRLAGSEGDPDPVARSRTHKGSQDEWQTEDTLRRGDRPGIAEVTRCLKKPRGPGQSPDPKAEMNQSPYDIRPRLSNR